MVGIQIDKNANYKISMESGCEDIPVTPQLKRNCNRYQFTDEKNRIENGGLSNFMLIR